MTLAVDVGVRTVTTIEGLAGGEGLHPVQSAVVLGAAAPVPHRAKAAEAALVGKAVDEAVARTAAHAALQGAMPLTMNGYKLPVFETLVRRAVLPAAQALRS